MRRNLLLLAAMLSMAFCLSGRVLSPGEARTSANTFLTGRVVTGQLRAPQSAGLTLWRTMNDASGRAALYLFTTSSGTMIVASAESETPSVLGYTDTPGDGNELNPALQEWLDGYRAEIGEYRDSEIATTAATPTPKRIQHDLATIQPLMHIKWNQGSPYNMYAPMAGTKRCPTGCVATAMSMVMKYHQWPPEHGYGTVKYTWKYDGTTVFEQDLEQSVYDWANMLEVYDDTATEANNTAVATLMRDVGYAVHMGYKPGGSGATTSNIAPALRNNFGYDTATRQIFRYMYTLSDWERAIYAELAAARPVILNGFTPTDAGHCFVCDGYGDDSFFHINWGWGGMSNGYFLLSALTPREQGIGGSDSGYNKSQSAIIGIQPPVPGSQPVVGMGLGKDFTIEPGSISTTSSDTIFFRSSYLNIGTDTIRGALGLKITNVNDTTDITYDQRFTMKLSPGSYFSQMIRFSKNLKPSTTGTYTIEPVWKLTGGEWQKFQYPATTIGIDTMKIKNGTRTFTPRKLHSKLEVVSPVLTTPLHPNYPFIMTGRLTNYGTDIYPDSITAALLRKTDKTIMYFCKTKMRSEIEPADTIPITFSSYFSSNVHDGNYDLVFMRPPNYIISSRIPVTVKAVTDTTVVSCNDLSVISDVQYNDLPSVSADWLRVQGTVKCESGYLNEKLNLVVFPTTSETGTSLKSIATLANTELFFLDSDSTKTVHLTCDFPDAESGKDYFVRLYDNNHNGISNRAKFHISYLTGIEEIPDENTPAMVITPWGRLEVIDPEPDSQLSLWRTDGICVAPPAHRTEIDLTPLAPGIYIARLQTPDRILTLRFAR